MFSSFKLERLVYDSFSNSQLDGLRNDRWIGSDELGLRRIRYPTDDPCIVSDEARKGDEYRAAANTYGCDFSSRWRKVRLTSSGRDVGMGRLSVASESARGDNRPLAKQVVRQFRL